MYWSLFLSSFWPYSLVRLTLFYEEMLIHCVVIKWHQSALPQPHPAAHQHKQIQVLFKRALSTTIFGFRSTRKMPKLVAVKRKATVTKKWPIFIMFSGLVQFWTFLMQSRNESLKKKKKKTGFKRYSRTPNLCDITSATLLYRGEETNRAKVEFYIRWSIQSRLTSIVSIRYF